MTIPYSDSRIAKVGRWQDTGSGIWSGWGGSQLKFRISGTASFSVNANVVCGAGKLCICECVMDNSPENSLMQYFANNENFSGARSVTFTLPDTGTHDIILKTNGYNADIFNGASKSVVTSIDVGAGTLSSPNLGGKLLQCVGDSWMAADCDWPRLMDTTLWNAYQIGTGGLTAANMDSQYAYAASGVTASDAAADAAIVSFGVNDYNNGVSVAAFQASILSIVNKIKARQSCPVFLIQTPRNGALAYDQYGSAMANVAVATSNVHYIDTSSIWSSLSWQSDNAHLASAGKVIFANFINTQITTTLGIIRSAIRVNGTAIMCSTIPTSAQYMRLNGLGLILPNGVRIGVS